MVLFNAVMNLITLACVAGLAAWSWHRERVNHRAVVRQLGRLRVAERDSHDLAAVVHQIRQQLARQPEELRQAYARGFLDAMEPRPPVTDSPTSPLLWIRPGRRTATDQHIRRSFKAVESGR